MSALPRKQDEVLDALLEVARSQDRLVCVILLALTIGLLSSCQPQPEDAKGPSVSTVRGRVIEGYGGHAPLYDLPIVVEARGRRLLAHTDAEGQFAIEGIPPGTHRGHANHLTFEWEASKDRAEVDLGTLKYPLIHPPSAWLWQPSPLTSVDRIRTEGELVNHTTCFEDPHWLRPSLVEQAREVWFREPFASEDPALLEAWFDRPAILFTSVDQYQQGSAGGPDLASVGAEQRYALGLWTRPDIIGRSDCDYRPSTLDGLVRGDPIEVWLLGRRARQVRRRLQVHDQPVTPTGPEARNAAPVVWSEARYAVYSEPAEGVSIIRFAGIDASSSPVAVHLIEDGRELAVLDPMESTFGR